MERRAEDRYDSVNGSLLFIAGTAESCDQNCIVEALCGLTSRAFLQGISVLACRSPITKVRNAKNAARNAAGRKRETGSGENGILSSPCGKAVHKEKSGAR